MKSWCALLSCVSILAACASSDGGETTDAGSSSMDASNRDAGTNLDATATSDARTDASVLDATTADSGHDDGGGEPDAGTALVPVYYVRDTDVGMRLYREFRRVPVTSDPVEAAVNMMLHEPALDPDYSSLWPIGTSINEISTAGSTLTIDLSSDALVPALGSEAEGISLQQLVYTITAANNSITEVALRIDGEIAETLWGHADISVPLTRASRVDVLAPVWIIDPQEGDQLSTLTITGDAMVFEATVSYRIERACLVDGCSDTPFSMSGTATAAEGAPGRGVWSATLSIPEAAYDGDALVRISAWEASAADGSVLHLDDKVIKVVR